MRIFAVSTGIRWIGSQVRRTLLVYVWIAHPNGEWTNYSHLAQGSVTELAKLEVGDEVATGDFLGIEGAVGCAMLDHLHFEVGPAGRSADRHTRLSDSQRTRQAR